MKGVRNTNRTHPGQEPIKVGCVQTLHHFQETLEVCSVEESSRHFMGKKSVVDAPLLPSPEDQGADALEVLVPTEQTALGELFHEFLRVALQAHVDTQDSRSKNEETDLIMKILENYMQSRK
ncbi:hypothetical protein FQA47_003141 [Oryzias melastigma]|uniref:Uncharacterized protein n=1 Tax=Oryzias melastigma TaxID=30732 RepID=A0A834CCS7_ORYME|nr:hypothetical protein FQA47_003141 [Oryzias melastigma]